MEGMGLEKVFGLLKEKGVDMDLECVYSVNFSEKKLLVAYQGVIGIDREMVCKK